MTREQKRYLCLVTLVSVSAAAHAWAQETGGTVVLGGTTYEVVPVHQLPASQIHAVPAGTEIHRVHVRRGSGVASVVAGEPVVQHVYQNVDSPIFATNGVNRLLADDIEVTAAGGCAMQSLEVVVFRPANAPAPEGFGVTQLSIWDRCPGQAGAVMLLDLLGGVPAEFSTNGAFALTLDLTGVEEPIPAGFWLAMAFNKTDAGWLGGSAPTIGFSQNIIHVDNPANPNLRCNAVFQPGPGLPDPYSAMYADIFCLGAESFFVGYQANVESLVFYGGGGCPGNLGGCGDGIDLESGCEITADSIKPIVTDCRMHSYSVNVAGTGGPFDMEFELWTDDRTDPLAPQPGAPIAGTRGCFHGEGSGFPERANFVFETPVTLPERVWLVWADNSENAGPIAAGDAAEIGTSEEFFAVYAPGGNNWPTFVLPDCPSAGAECANFQITLTCLGDEPTGACCDRVSGTCADGLFVRDCLRSVGRFVAEETCDTATFNPACGATACCKVDPNDITSTICEDEFPADCTAASGESTMGVFCEAIEDCGIPACIGATGDCLGAHEGTGCSDNVCCNLVCRTDGFCCDNVWDGNCGELASEVCGSVAPPNDSCADAEEIAIGTVAFNTTAASTDGPPLPDGIPAEEPDCGSGTGQNRYLLGKDIWFKHTPATGGTLNVSLCSESTDYDSRLAVYEGCTCPPSLIGGCDDDGCNVEFRSLLDVLIRGGTCYLIRVGGWGEASFGLGELALSFVPQTCPSLGSVTFVDPPADTVDARQPHPVNSLTPRQGIQSFVIQAPAGADDTCFEICETDDEGAPLTWTVNENPAGTYTITLSRTITTGAATTVTYSGTNTTGVFRSHPGNVNSFDGANPADLTAMVNCLDNVNKNTNCPLTPYNRDLDHSGALNPLDLLTAANLLNGAGVNHATNGTTEPSNAGCP